MLHSIYQPAVFTGLVQLMCSRHQSPHGISLCRVCLQVIWTFAEMADRQLRWSEWPAWFEQNKTDVKIDNPDHVMWCVPCSWFGPHELFSD